MSEHFCLRWNNHQSTLVSVFEHLLESETLIDCTLCAEGQLLKAHKVVLSACSPCFESMLCVQEDKHPIIFLKDVKFIELKAMLDYMYRGEVNIHQDHLASFISTATALQIKGLADKGGGGGTGDEPPAKKGPGRKTGMSDVAPESPLVGNAPLREGSISPSTRRRRRPRRPSTDDVSADNSCDIPALPATPLPTPAAPPQATQADIRTSTPGEPRLLTVKKQEPMDTPMIQPKTEYMEETNEDIEDLTLDDDDDYNDMSDMSKPGTSYGMAQGGSSSQPDFSNWQMMGGDRTGQDEVFMAATEAINNQSNPQVFFN
ncbi:longitudinals lacking protein, isoforms H/M/V-like [Cimex lectularius]|uniref:BTB domain-containing protein n=1 Tax=Cimex lectularius TaxID=79782 RepID=A0A8I6TEX7_CIMLE|nr:longitudinals lacking protein, isoforms H/M/V-like [Cimex lectularius]